MKDFQDLREVFAGRSVLVTGHTGFKGSWLSMWLARMGGVVTGIADGVPTSPSHFESIGLSDQISDLRIDIRDRLPLVDAIKELKPEFVFHLAAQALVHDAYLDPVRTYETNVLGTLNLLEALRGLSHPCSAVIVTSDKCYDNLEWVWGYRESDRLGGSDPYSGSKGAAELVIRSHIKSYFQQDSNVRVGIARAGNVIGGGDWAPNRVVPDCIRQWSENRCTTLRNPNATRPWQHVLEPLHGYMVLGRALARDSLLHGEPFNFGPSITAVQNVKALVSQMSENWPDVHWRIQENMRFQPESTLLKLNCDKAEHFLGWETVLSFEETVAMTIEWYRTYYEDCRRARSTTLEQIEYYEQLLEERR